MDQHFYNGFIKRAQDYGLSVKEADIYVNRAGYARPSILPSRNPVATQRKSETVSPVKQLDTSNEIAKRLAEANRQANKQKAIRGVIAKQNLKPRLTEIEQSTPEYTESEERALTGNGIGADLAEEKTRNDEINGKSKLLFDSVKSTDIPLADRVTTTKRDIPLANRVTTTKRNTPPANRITTESNPIPVSSRQSAKEIKTNPVTPQVPVSPVDVPSPLSELKAEIPSQVEQQTSQMSNDRAAQASKELAARMANQNINREPEPRQISEGDIAVDPDPEQERIEKEWAKTVGGTNGPQTNDLLTPEEHSALLDKTRDIIEKTQQQMNRGLVRDNFYPAKETREAKNSPRKWQTYSPELDQERNYMAQTQMPSANDSNIRRAILGLGLRSRDEMKGYDAWETSLNDRNNQLISKAKAMKAEKLQGMQLQDELRGLMSEMESNPNLPDAEARLADIQNRVLAFQAPEHASYRETANARAREEALDAERRGPKERVEKYELEKAERAADAKNKGLPPPIELKARPRNRGYAGLSAMAINTLEDPSNYYANPGMMDPSVDLPPEAANPEPQPEPEPQLKPQWGRRVPPRGVAQPTWSRDLNGNIWYPDGNGGWSAQPTQPEIPVPTPPAN
jgi:hypothetical protein